MYEIISQRHFLFTISFGFDYYYHFTIAVCNILNVFGEFCQQTSKLDIVSSLSLDSVKYFQLIGTIFAMFVTLDISYNIVTRQIFIRLITLGVSGNIYTSPLFFSVIDIPYNSLTAS